MPSIAAIIQVECDLVKFSYIACKTIIFYLLAEAYASKDAAPN